MTSQLAIVLSKITHRMSWDEWDLTENEYILVENASGSEIIEAAYKNELPIAQFIRNFTELTEKHNERSLQRTLRELKNLKLDLLSALPRKQKEKTSTFDSDEIERRLAEEAIDEVSGLSTIENLNVTPEELIDIAAELKKRGIIGSAAFKTKSKPAYQDTLPTISNASRVESPSLQRNQISSILEPPHITINDIPATSISMLTGNDFEEAGVDEVANMGLFDGITGRSLYDAFKARESFNASMAQRKGTTLPDILVTDIDELPSAPVFIEDVLPKLNDICSDKPANNVAELSPGPVVIDLSDVPNDVQPLKSQRVNAPIESIAQAQAADNITIDPPSQAVEGRSRIEQFQKKVVELENQVFQKPKQRRARRKHRSPAATDQNVYLEPINPLVIHRRRQKKPVLCRVLIHKIDLDFLLEDVEEFGADEIGEDYSLNCWNAPASSADVQVFVEDLPPICDIPESKVHQIQTPLKRRRLEVVKNGTAVEDITQVEALVPDFIPDSPRAVQDRPSELRDTSSLHVPDVDPFIDPAIVSGRSSADLAEKSKTSAVETPINMFQPRITSTVALAKRACIQTVTNDDIEFARLRQVSEQSLNPNVVEKTAVQTLLETLERSEPTTESAANEIAPKKAVTKPTTFRTIEGVREIMVEMVVDGKVESYSAYWMETMALYLQTRFLMKERGTWKMKFADVLPLVGLLKEKRRLVIESRYMLLAKNGFCKLTLDVEEDNIVDIEIPVQEK